ncbi:MAG: ornithine--oxo-acid transaminase [Acidimicrobiia bacterium]|nr:ornithine--oxo-acid transaminase [Acidimicrobiia bacterium]
MTSALGAAGRTAELMAAEAAHCARNYHPLPVVLAEGEGSWVTDVEGRRYLDLLSAYSALNFGHRHPRLVAAAHRQLDRLTLTSRAFHNDQLGPFCAELAELCGMEVALPMNTGAEAVETAVKVARRWGYERREVATDGAEIIVFDGNFHGRTTTIVSFSGDPSARKGFGPFTPGFVRVPFGDLGAVRRATGPRTVAVLVEPVQGEAGVVPAPPGFLAALRAHCDEFGLLLVADEIQSGLGRTGRTFACDHEGVVPDLYVLGKALGGGLVPLSAVVGRWDVLGVIGPGEHGSTFGGNPLATAIGREVIAMLRPGDLQARAARLGAATHDRLAAAALPGVSALRARGLWWALDLDEGGPTGRQVCEALAQRGVLAKDTHERTVRFAPPLTIDERDLDHALDVIEATLRVPGLQAA